ncbi:translation elongation factor Ts [Streptococcus uberis]|uniref:translation elongation factor Ts n=1 Tax=Streptococcus uberis TaxID=1349 RepID=UPI000541A314|nr:translation elongation factor Ts [Streptococcus uberis]KHD40071.1 elongation factor Ts [Streptococcus hongkongensis]KKF41321.1 elongation factor Ts [Streptococcus uberis EF20/0145]KKF46141.1 elongation factor Ts [Streptococcus uberis C5072]KKF58866.1 elongation factor Ts [Streptococcus uberis C6344]MCK1161526.1 translation elongation factor Ts [Streptococcus uberis]
MAEITAKLVKELREKSGAGVMDAKKALVETDGDMDKAIELLREKGMAKAAKKADRVAAEGLTGVYVSGNYAAVVEVNAETDFVAKNAQFVELVNDTAKTIAEGKPANNEEALNLIMPSGETLAAAYVNATATIGEKISFRRFSLLEKTDEQHFGAYQHNGGRIGVISVIEGGDDALAKQVSMHIAAMKPTVLSYTELDPQFVKDELAKLNHDIELDNESRAMVDKAPLPFLQYGSKAQLSEDVITKAEEDIKAELAAEGKPEKIWDKIIPGKMDRFMLDNTKVDQAYTLLAQVYIMDDSKTVEAYLDSVNAKAIAFARFEVGEGIEKKANDFESEVAATMAAALNN